MTTPTGPISVTITTGEPETFAVTQAPAPGLSLATTGPQGTPGTKIHSVAGAPSNSVGLVGDFALDSNTGRLYGPKESTGWPTWSQIPPLTGAGWTLNGFANLVGDDTYLTSAGEGFGAGTAWSTNVQPSELDVTFEMEMSGGTGADGITFAFANSSTADTFVGGGGGDLGLVGADAVAVAFDTAAGSRARIVTTTATAMTTVYTYPGVLSLRAAPVTVRVKYESGRLYVWVDGVEIFNPPVSIAADSRIGWTGSNGGSDDNHIIRNVQFAPTGGLSLVGEAGPQGPQGDTGPQGAGVLVLNAGDPVPGGTSVGTVILRRA
ncbi:hypothetical protein PP460_gp221 [Streptomyces phage Muntaha]|uniref:Uncharacterized protein n=1 Tax=Streptomyces phage Muntaha TaxID=2713269 RepID=A0A6G8R332_9CAUD|nr:hypothetical protein PP460_gp221 [Streptomyces phage Muntaha]QIN94583.1 hypothetical protein SEA_MUNTAHA_26 [Streptomyces phage Muntaha]